MSIKEILECAAESTGSRDVMRDYDKLTGEPKEICHNFWLGTRGGNKYDLHTNGSVSGR